MPPEFRTDIAPERLNEWKGLNKFSPRREGLLGSGGYTMRFLLLVLLCRSLCPPPLP